MSQFTSLRKRPKASPLLVVLSLLLTTSLSACSVLPPSDPVLLRNTYCELVDWHISGLWIINCPTAWVRVANYNAVPIKDIVLEYGTYDADGHALDTGTYPLEGEVGPGSVRNFIELYLGLVSIHSEKLSIKVVAVTRGP